ncbi:GTP-binding protein [Kocuria indica]|uniref:GTP-binding protein n=1 Tax=Kocuria marina subsp. indica TaxID=1049583 RepID=A0A6N9QW94_9MICC|nr:MULTISPECIES: GTP-binding protein [Kocuria]MCT1615050.1 GTP-binding protein [Kocuria marina]NDO76698.1 GTP-binding protein [Kocuria indica]
MPSTLPVLILTGYLGSGKTTVLNHFLATGGARIGVIINDFGDVNVDAALVAGHVAEPVSIAGGCLCCIEDPRQLDDALRALSRPSLELDAIVIEGSGIAEPPGLIHMVLGSDVRDVRFGGLVEVIAVRRVALAEAGGWDLAQHVKAAAVVLLTTTDLADPRTTAAVCEQIAHANPHALVIDAPHGAADPRLFFDAAEHPVPEGGQLALWEFGRAPGHDHHDHDHHVHHRATSLDAPTTVDPAALAELLEDPPGSVHRVKAIVDVAAGRGIRRFVAHSVAGYVSVEKVDRPSDEPPRSRVVAIGLEHDDAALRRRLDALVRPDGSPAATARELRRLTRFL